MSSTCPFRLLLNGALIAFLALTGLALTGLALTGLALTGHAQAQTGPVPGNPSNAIPTLDERRQVTRDRAIRAGVTRCRAAAQRVSALATRPCAEDDFLDQRRNLCLPRKNRYPAYLRWDPAAGRCRPRDGYEQGSCAGPKGRYAPGRRHAHSPVASIRMYGAATGRAEAALRRCEANLTTLRKAAARRHQVAAQNCAISKRLNRRDLVALHCK
jgi:hypothetical protein